MLRFLARFIAVVFALVFVVGAIPILFFQAAGTHLTGSQVYKDALTKERIYDRLPALVADTATQAVAADERAAANRGAAVEESPANLIRQLSPGDWEMVFGAVLPSDYVRRQTEHALDQFFGWLHSSAAVPVVDISLGELKQRLVAPETEETYVRLLRTKPPCPTSQLQSARQLPVGCCPSPQEMPQVRQGFRTMMQKTADQMPESVNLFAKLSGEGANAEATRRLAEGRTRLVELECIARWSPTAPAVLLLLIALFAVRSFRGWMLWWGIPCLIVGAVSAVFALLAVPAGQSVFSNFVVPHLPAEFPAATLNALAELVMAVLQSVANAVFHSASALTVGGLVAVILGAVFKSRPQPTAPAPGGGNESTE